MDKNIETMICKHIEKWIEDKLKEKDEIINGLNDDIQYLGKELWQREKEVKELRHFHDTAIGLWVTDREDAIDPIIKKKYFWRLEALNT